MLIAGMVATFTARPDLIQVLYKVQSDILLDPEKKARTMALGQTTGRWSPKDISGKKLLAKHQGVVLGIDERPHIEGRPYEYFLSLGFPAQNTEGDIPSLLTMIFGKLSLNGKVRVESIEFPDAYLDRKGPRFGISGIRERVGEPEQPLAMATLQPCVGLSATDLGRMFYELACGGMHLVRDHENLPDLSICPTEKRLEECLKAGERAKAATGQTTLYAVNLTGPTSKLAAKARKLAKQGAPCFLVNVLSYGVGLLEELRDIGVPLLAHPALSGASCGSPDTGWKYSVILGTLMRLGGADIVLFPSRYGEYALPEDETNAILKALTGSSMDPLLKSWPAPLGGIQPGLLPKILQDYGQNVIMNAGSGIHDHPNGARAGAKALRQAIHWVTQRGNFGGLSEREFPELAEALRLWRKQ